jgi:hypothetical protein
VTPESAGSSLASTPEEEKARTALIVGACSTSANVTTVAPSRPPPKHQPTSRSRAHRDSRGCGRAACGGGKHRRSSGDTVLTLGLQEGNAKRCGDRASIQYCVPGIRNPTRLQLPNDVRVPELRVRSREFLDAVLISGASRSQCGTLLRSCFASLPCPRSPHRLTSRTALSPPRRPERRRLHRMRARRAPACQVRSETRPPTACAAIDEGPARVARRRRESLPTRPD